MTSAPPAHFGYRLQKSRIPATSHLHTAKQHTWAILYTFDEKKHLKMNDTSLSGHIKRAENCIQGSYSFSKNQHPRLFPDICSQSQNIPGPIILPHILVSKLRKHTVMCNNSANCAPKCTRLNEISINKQQYSNIS